MPVKNRSSSSTTEQEKPMHHLSNVLAVAEDLEIPESHREAVLAAVEEFTRGGDETGTVKAYVAGEHSSPVVLPSPLTVIRCVEVSESEIDGYLVTVAGAHYSNGHAVEHDLVDLFRKGAIKGGEGLKVLPHWEDVRIGKAHVVGLRQESVKTRTLPSGITGTPISTTLRVLVGRESEAYVPARRRPPETRVLHTFEQVQTGAQAVTRGGRVRHRPVVD
ncbi:hypothetical protein BH708_03885 [Brachybacterium sp. P6-10-X1]|uniref:hypothetical protein n=1 Tax=Brachybacterium sp. P6-10-X1 TaxID=1903186 RepID=UPI000971AEC0|nr:hypothetical protein [Brachybacterium sp. P6-10-X1]APX32009.1 hypothetical protein BH708_03885 [Brachybacterium sp. P6-10-X1]